MTRLAIACLVLALLLPLSSAGAQGQATAGQPQLGLPRGDIIIGGHAVQVQVAGTDEARQTGLMFRAHMPEDEGMLFVYDFPRVRCMWMQNTLIPLTAAFLDGGGRILGFADMEPLTTQAHCSPEPASFVLEMNEGWFARRGVAAGDKIDLRGIGSQP
ncbi:DUF192 domain-containing protein [Desulfomicrobium salsuginis]